MSAPYTVFKDSNGSLTTAGQRQQLAPPTPCAKVFISAGKNNQGDLVFGGPTVVGAVSGRSGSAVSSGNSMTVEIDDLSKIWIDGEFSGDTYSYSYLF